MVLFVSWTWNQKCDVLFFVSDKLQLQAPTVVAAIQWWREWGEEQIDRKVEGRRSD
jgi:hypothetical protein